MSPERIFFPLKIVKAFAIIIIIIIYPNVHKYIYICASNP